MLTTVDIKVERLVFHSPTITNPIPHNQHSTVYLGQNNRHIHTPFAFPLYISTFLTSAYRQILSKVNHQYSTFLKPTKLWWYRSISKLKVHNLCPEWNIKLFWGQPLLLLLVVIYSWKDRHNVKQGSLFKSQIWFWTPISRIGAFTLFVYLWLFWLCLFIPRLTLYLFCF